MKPQVNQNQKATDVEAAKLGMEELEEMIAPGVHLQHHETFVCDADEIELHAEELEEVIAPGRGLNHNETLLRDAKW